MSKKDIKELEKTVKEMTEKIAQEQPKILTIVGLDEVERKSYLELKGQLNALVENSENSIKQTQEWLQDNKLAYDFLLSIQLGYIHNRDLREFEDWVDKQVESVKKVIEHGTKQITQLEKVKENALVFINDINGVVNENGDYEISEDIRKSLNLFNRYFRISENIEK
jgi:CRISPR/Cas system CSM-associated protein Csm2 small subunit